MKKGLFAVEEPRHEEAQRLGKRQNDQKKDGDVQNADGSHGASLESLWSK
jgi:hypothetical protein